MLAYKAERYGRTVIAVDRWYPSSKTCSACGHLLAELSLGTRYWTCPACGTHHDRDVNAAQNILAAGLAVTACGGGVRRTETPRRSCPRNRNNPRRQPWESPSVGAGRMSTGEVFLPELGDAAQ